MKNIVILVLGLLFSSSALAGGGKPAQMLKPKSFVPTGGMMSGAAITDSTMDTDQTCTNSGDGNGCSLAYVAPFVNRLTLNPNNPNNIQSGSEACTIASLAGFKYKSTGGPKTDYGALHFFSTGPGGDSSRPEAVWYSSCYPILNTSPSVPIYAASDSIFQQDHQHYASIDIAKKTYAIRKNGWSSSYNSPQSYWSDYAYSVAYINSLANTTVLASAAITVPQSDSVTQKVCAGYKHYAQSLNHTGAGVCVKLMNHVGIRCEPVPNQANTIKCRPWLPRGYMGN